MDLVLKRIARKETYTIGRLYINGVYACDTLEDKDRGLDNDTMSIAEIKAVKVPGETAIPTGKYEVSITYSPRFKRMMPLLSGVKGFDGVRIHSGNTHKDTEGCILVGRNKVVGKVLDSRYTYNNLYKKLEAASKRGEYITIEIK
jgi:hypothetical protein